ncbi:MAG: alpha/beta hydrolase [Crocinitomicaceae bacterium]|nr:alpha/beta hydrolase [Crocinitomicaceae bacterium]
MTTIILPQSRLNEYPFTQIEVVIKNFLLVIFSSVYLNQVYAESDKTNVYLIPGQGSDYRIFDSLHLPNQYSLIHVQHGIPEEGMTMSEYAGVLFNQVDTSSKYILIGVSLGGMLAVEMNEFHKPEKTIIISSAKCRAELPDRYLLQEYLPIYQLVSEDMCKKGALFLQPIVEPDRKNQKKTFISMLEDKDPLFFKRTITMILEWQRINYSDEIIHIHGDEDRTIPARNVDYDYLIEGGSHMMTLTKGSEIGSLIVEILDKK